MSDDAPPHRALPQAAAQIATEEFGHARSRMSRLSETARGNVVYIALVVTFLVFVVLLQDRGFATLFNFQTILRQAAPIAVMAVAAVFVLSSGEIDLSIGSVVALGAVAAALGLREGGLLLGLATGLGAGLLIGSINGVLVTKARIPSFLVTLGTLQAVAGAARVISDEQSIAVQNATYILSFGGGAIGPISTLFVWAIGLILVGHFVYRHQRFGAHVRATGDNRRAAISAGINTDRIRFQVLVLSAISASIAGMLYAGQLQSARYILGANDLLTVIAAVIIGGTSLFGGRGTIVGAAIGAVLLAMFNNGLILLGLSVAEQQIALGTVIIVSVLLGRERARA